MTDRNDWFAAIFLALVIGIALGYAWAYYHGKLKYEYGYTDGVKEMSVIAKGEICQ